MLRSHDPVDSFLVLCAPQVLAYVCEQRADFVGAPGGLQQALEALLGAAQSANSAARRFRMRCLKAVVVLLLREDTAIDFEVPGVEETTVDGKRQQVRVTRGANEAKHKALGETVDSKTQCCK